MVKLSSTKTNEVASSNRVKLDDGANKKRKLTEDKQQVKGKTPKPETKKIEPVEVKTKKPRTEPPVEPAIAETKKVKTESKPAEKSDKVPRVDYKNGKVSKFNNQKKPYTNNSYNSNKNGKPDAEKAPVLDKKELKKQRRMKKLSTSYDLNVDMKKIWETLRKSETTTEVRQKLCRSLHERIKGNVKNMVFAHDTVRVIQCLIEYGNEAQRETVFAELKDEFIPLSKSRYARFVVEKFLKYGTKEQKDYIINCFMGNVTKLIKHSYACKIVEAIFNEYATRLQRNKMLNEFYGVPLTEKPYGSLADYINENTNNKEKILTHVKEILQTCIEKTILMFSIIHNVFHEYLKNCDQKQKSEMIEALSEHLVEMVHTKDGTHVGMQCVWFSTAKQRKVIIKSLKSFIKKIACEEHGHQVLLAIFDSVDDTKFVSKLVLDELFRSMNDLFLNDYGRKVLTYLIVPRDQRFFIKDYVRKLEPGDNSETSKKSTDIRRNELCAYSLKFFHDYINENLNSILTNGAAGILIPEVFPKLDEAQLSEVLTKLASLLLKDEHEKDKDHLIENATAHYILKHILVNDKSNKLVDLLLDHVHADNMKSWCKCNRGCFTLVKMIEVSDADHQERLRDFLNEKNLLKNLKEASFGGAKVLLEKLNQTK